MLRECGAMPGCEVSSALNSRSMSLGWHQDALVQTSVEKDHMSAMGNYAPSVSTTAPAACLVAARAGPGARYGTR